MSGGDEQHREQAAVSAADISTIRAALNSMGADYYTRSVVLETRTAALAALGRVEARDKEREQAHADLVGQFKDASRRILTQRKELARLLKAKERDERTSGDAPGGASAVVPEPETPDTVRAFLRAHGRPDLADEIQAGIDREAALLARVKELQEALRELQLDFGYRGDLGASPQDVAMWLRMATTALAAVSLEQAQPPKEPT